MASKGKSADGKGSVKSGMLMGGSKVASTVIKGGSPPKLTPGKHGSALIGHPKKGTS